MDNNRAHWLKSGKSNITFTTIKQYNYGRDQVSQKSKSRDYRYTRKAIGREKHDLIPKNFEEVTKVIKQNKGNY